MAWYYVKSGGTATLDAGRATTERTTSFATMGASAYYPNVAGVLDGTAVTTTPVPSDTLSVSDVHAHSTSSNIIYNLSNSGVPIVVNSVDDTAANVLKAGATETCTSSSNDIYIGSVTNNNGIFYGMHFVSNDNIRAGASANCRVLFRSCELEVTGAGDIALSVASDGVFVRCEDCTFTFGNVNGHLGSAYSGALLEIIGGQTSGSAITELFQDGGVSGGVQIYMTGFDMSSISSSASLISNMGGSATLDDVMVVRLHNCRLPASWAGAFVEETQTENGSHRQFELVATDDTDAFTYEYVSNLGQVLHSTSTYVTGDTDVEGATNYSFQINTTTNCSKTAPFRWQLPVAYEDLSAVSTDNIRVRITSANALTQEEVAVVVGTSDATTNTLMNIASSVETLAESSAWIPDHTATGGTALVTDGSQWTGAQTNQYAIVVDLSAVNVDATSPLSPTIWLEVYKDETFYVSSQLVFEA